MEADCLDQAQQHLLNLGRQRGQVAAGGRSPAAMRQTYGIITATKEILTVERTPREWKLLGLIGADSVDAYIDHISQTVSKAIGNGMHAASVQLDTLAKRMLGHAAGSSITQPAAGTPVIADVHRYATARRKELLEEIRTYAEREGSTQQKLRATQARVQELERELAEARLANSEEGSKRPG